MEKIINNDNDIVNVMNRADGVILSDAENEGKVMLDDGDNRKSLLTESRRSLPDIKDGDFMAVLAEREGKQIVGLHRVDSNTQKDLGVTVICRQGKALISNGQRLTFSKEAIIKSKDYRIMRKLYQFNLELDNEDLKESFERLMSIPGSFPSPVRR